MSQYLTLALIVVMCLSMTMQAEALDLLSGLNLGGLLTSLKLSDLLFQVFTLLGNLIDLVLGALSGLTG